MGGDEVKVQSRWPGADRGGVGLTGSIPARKLKYISHRYFSINEFNSFMASQLKSKIMEGW